MFGVGPDAEDAPLPSADECFPPVSASSEPINSGRMNASQHGDALELRNKDKMAHSICA